MKSLLANIAQKIWPDFQSMAELDRLALLRELLGILFGLPFVIIAVVWLAAQTDLALLRQQWPVLLLLLGLSVLAGRLSFFQISVGSDGSYSYNGSSLEIIIVFSGMFLLGPTAVWVPFLGRLIEFRLDRPSSPSTRQKASRIRNLLFNLGASILGLLLALWLWPLPIWSAMGTRERRHNTGQLVFSTPRPVWRPCRLYFELYARGPARLSNWRTCRGPLLRAPEYRC